MANAELLQRYPWLQQASAPTITTGAPAPDSQSPTGGQAVDRSGLQSNPQPYTNWNDEMNWFRSTVTPHVQSKPFLYGKVNDSDIARAFETYNQYRSAHDRAGSYNRTLDDLGWWTGQVTSAPPSASPAGGGGPQGGNYQQWFNSLVSGQAANPNTLASLEQTLGQYGVKVLRNAAGIAGKIQLPDGQIVDVGQKFSSGDPSRMRWQWLTGSGGGSSVPSGFSSSYAAQFSDPLTQQYERLLQSQTSLYQQQQRQMQIEAQRQQQARKATDEAVQRLMGFLNERVDRLGQPAYSDSEAEVLRTRALDPIERDRTAANERALQNIGARGFDPTSGIAQDLLRQVNQGYDQTRAGAQNELAYRQIQEQRSREQEKQELLQYLSQLPLAAARGDIDFLTYLNSAINQPGRESLATGAMLSDLPVQRTQLALQTLGLGGQPQSSLPGVMSLLNNAQSNRFLQQQQGSDFWRNIGLSF